MINGNLFHAFRVKTANGFLGITVALLSVFFTPEAKADTPPQQDPAPDSVTYSTDTDEVRQFPDDSGYMVKRQKYTPVTLSMLRDFERYGINLTRIQFYLSSGITLLSEENNVNYEVNPGGDVKRLRFEQVNKLHFKKNTGGRLLTKKDIHKVDDYYVMGISFGPDKKNILYFSQYTGNINIEHDYFYIQPVDYTAIMAYKQGKYGSMLRVHYGDKDYFINTSDGIPYLMIKYDEVLNCKETELDVGGINLPKPKTEQRFRPDTLPCGRTSG